MRVGHMAVGALTGMALIVGSVAPAAARDRHRNGGYSGGYGGGYGGGGWGRDRHRHHDDFNFGDAVGIAALIGAVAIVASSISKDRKSRDRVDGTGDRPLPRAQGDETQDYAPDASGDLADENAAVDACAVAARDEASSGSGYAEVRDMDAPRAVSGGWDIDGQVERRAAYRDQNGDVRRFTCSVRNGRVTEVYLSRDVTA